MKRNTTTIKEALRRVDGAARRRAFRKDRPIAISIGGKAFLLYPDGRKVPFSKSILRQLSGKK